jgi:hypothetical protein
MISSRSLRLVPCPKLFAIAACKTRRRARARLSLETLEDRLAPAVFNVTSFADTVEATRNGSGLDASGNISLRSAIMATNDIGGINTINLPAGTYQLAIPPDSSNGDDTGNLNIGRGLVQNNVTINGDSAATTIIDGNALDQVFNVGFFCTATLANLTIQNGKDTFGGGVSNAGQATLLSDVILNNTASAGAGVFNNGTLMMGDCVIAGNSASQGGGILNGGTMTIADTTVAGNMAGQGGGILNSGQLTITGTTISGNTTTAVVGEGGGLLNQSVVALTNDTIAGNMASQGGGVYTFGQGPASFVNCTISGNTASGAFFSGGGGIYEGIGNPVVPLQNTIVALNTSGTGPDIQGAVASMGHNLIGIGTGASGFVSSDLIGTSDNPIDPLLGPLQDNGGPTYTMALLPGSPAIDAGDNTGAPAYDQRGPGFARIVGGTIDIGAFEVQPGATIELVLSTVAGITAGVPFAVTVTALDNYGHVASGYTGTVTFTSSDLYPGVLPSDYTFTSGDGGTQTFAGVTFFTAGAQTLTVQDTADSTLAASVTIAVTAAPANHFLITAPATTVSGTPFDVIVTALDPYGNVDTNYAGTATFTSSDTDSGVILPADYTFQATDSGTHTFALGVTLITTGDQTLTASDTSDGTVTGSTAVAVTPPGGGGSTPRSPIMHVVPPIWSVPSGSQVALMDRLFGSLNAGSLETPR